MVEVDQVRKCALERVVAEPSTILEGVEERTFAAAREGPAVLAARTGFRLHKGAQTQVVRAELGVVVAQVA